jgi:hypothetical protein
MMLLLFGNPRPKLTAAQMKKAAEAAFSVPGALKD